ncbi:MAG: tetratricopeptide repeat protein [Deltaproteobacteria bacterium]|nr:tetratricopeptide repeat protein [Deltaproteobacteria bacterium]
MKFSKIKIIFFFAAVFILSWFLYPRELFLGYIYEGTREFQRAETFYRQYLEKRPYNKFATFRLVHLFERMGEPEKGTILLEQLVRHRPSDWKVTERYLEHLENTYDPDKLYATKMATADNFLKNPLFPRGKAEILLDDALQEALWRQDFDNAYAIIEKILKITRHPENILSLKRDLDWGLQNTQAVTLFLEADLKNDPTNEESRLELATIYFVSGKKEKSLALLQEGLLQNPNSKKLLLAYFYLLDKSNRVPEAIAVLQNYLRLFPNDEEKTGYLVKLYLYRQRDPDQLPLYEAYLEKTNDKKVAIDVAELLYDKKSFEEGEAFARRLLEEHKNDCDVLRLIGRQTYYAGKYKQALHTLEEAVEACPNNAHNLFWLAEVHHALGHEEQMRQIMPKAVRQFAAMKHRTVEEERYYLKAQARLHFDQAMEKQYLAKIKAVPKESGFYEDLFEFYVNEREAKKAHELHQLLRANFPRNEVRETEYEAILASLDKNWEEAIRKNKQVIQRKPNDMGPRYALADAYYNSNQWEEAIRTYEEAAHLNPDEKKAREPIRLLRETYDNRLTSSFESGFFGEDRFWREKLIFTTFLTETWVLSAEGSLQKQKASAASFNDFAEKGKFTLGQEKVSGFVWNAGAGFGRSPVENSPAGFGLLGWKGFKTDLFLQMQIQELRDDFPQAVAGGDLTDSAILDFGTRPTERLYLFGRTLFRHDTIPSGLNAYELLLEPGLSFELVRFPVVNIGYRFTFSEGFLDNGFAATVPLVERVRAHILTAEYFHAFTEQFHFGTYFFAGEDTARNMHLFEGDLFGAGGNLIWKASTWLDLKGNYSFGKENLATIAGTNHQFNVVLSGHWH